jgi:uncharacterized membrane protein YfcA
MSQIEGCVLMMIISGLSSLAGLGGGGPNVVCLILFFDVLPKDATIMVFACIFGSSLGNVVNQARRALDGKPVVNYNYASITIPIMFIGTIFGVFINKLLPSVATVSIIMFFAMTSIPKIFRRFFEGYQNETRELEEYHNNQRTSGLIKETSINPFENHFNIKVFQRLGVMVLGYVTLSLLKGSEKFPSIFGIDNCSLPFWLIEIGIFFMAWYFYKSNRHFSKVWHAPEITLGEELFEREEEEVEKHEKELIKYSIGAGIFSGLGLGGGIFLVPMYRHLGLTSFQATSTCAFTVFITSGINAIQALFLGVLSFKQFFFFFGINSIGSFFISVLISTWLRRINRTSIVELMLGALLTLSTIYLPYSLWLKKERSGGDWSVILGFGSLC